MLAGHPRGSTIELKVSLGLCGPHDRQSGIILYFSSWNESPYETFAPYGSSYQISQFDYDRQVSELDLHIGSY